MYFFAGATVILPGVLMPLAAQTMGVLEATVGSAYSAAGFGMLLSIMSSGFLVQRFDLKTILMVNILGLIVAISGLHLYESLAYFAVAVMLVGLCGGMFIAIANILLVRLFHSTQRSAKLIRLDFLFSFGALVYPMLVSALLKRGYSWHTIYDTVLVIAAVVGVMALVLRFPDFAPQATSQDKATKAPEVLSGLKKFNIALAFLGCFFYISSEGSFSFWIVSYLKDVVNMPMSTATLSLTVFWVAIAVGRFLSSIAVQHVSFKSYVLGSIVLAMAAFAALLKAQQPEMIFTCIGLMGLGYACLYPSIISHGTLLVKDASPKLVSFFLTGGTLGFMISASLVSSQVQSHYGALAALYLGFAFMGLVLLIMLVSFRLKALSHRVEPTAQEAFARAQ
jgi:fucose permease